MSSRRTLSPCVKHTTVIEATQLPGVLNFLANQQSRMRNEFRERKLQAETFKQIWAIWEPRIGLFATARDQQLDLFVSWRPQPKATSVYAFSLDWNSLKKYAFPLFNMTAICLTKIKSHQPDSCGTGFASAAVVASNSIASLFSLSSRPPSYDTGITPASRLVFIRDRFEAFRNEWFLWMETVKPCISTC